MKASDLKDWALIGAVIAVGFVVYNYVIKPISGAKDSLDTLGKNIGDAVYDFFHGDFLAKNFLDNVKLSNGKVVSIPRQIINDVFVFPHTGRLYSLKKKADGSYVGVLSPQGTKYEYPEFTAIQDVYNVRVVNK